MDELTSLENFPICDVFDIEGQQIKELEKKYKKLFEKIAKKISKQAKKDSMKNWFRISIDDYSPQEMRAIKRYFCDYCGFVFSTTIPTDELKVYNTLAINGYTISTTANGNISKPTIVNEFFITWFNY